MKNLLDITLESLLRGSLSNNAIASRLLNLVRSGSFVSSSIESSVSRLLSGAPKALNLMDVKYQPGFVDMRFRHLILGNVKKYGLTDSGKHYGISFSDRDNQPVHSVFLGSNGVGKTSLFAALEYFGMKKMNTAKIRGYKREIGQNVDVAGTGTLEKDQSEFLCHVEKKLSDVSIKIATNNGDYQLSGDNYDRELPKLVTEAFYCSDFDVRQLEESDDYTDFFVAQLGLSEYIRALDLLYTLGEYVSKERTRVSSVALLGTGNKVDDVAIARAVLGISLALPGFKIELLAEAEDFNGMLKSLVGDNKNVHLKVLEDAKRAFKKEQDLFSFLDVYGEEVRNRYAKVIEDLSILYDIILDKDYQISSNALLELDRFLEFRSKLCQEAIILQGEKNTSPSRYFKIQENYMKRYVRALDAHDKVKEEQKAIPGAIATPEEQSAFDRDYLQLLGALEMELSKKLGYWMPKVQDSVKNLLKGYFLTDNDAIDVSYSLSPAKIEDGNSLEQVLAPERVYRNVSDFLSFNISILSCKGNLKSENRVPIPPRSYLNTFKYKLFCVALKLSLIVVLKRIYAINYPFVIDDVFDASDFSSRLDLKDFVGNLVLMHNSMVGVKDAPLQLIFFTQDDVIARQVEKGLISASGRSQVKFGHIFDYHEAKEESDLVFTADSIEGNALTYVSLEDEISKCVL